MVDGVGIGRDLAQGVCQQRIADGGADWQHLALRVVEDLADRRVLGQLRQPLQAVVQIGRHREAVFGAADAGLEQAGPRQLAVALVRQRHDAHGAGHAHRAAVARHVLERQGVAVDVGAQAGGGARRGRGQAVQGRQRGAALVPHQHQRTAAQAGRLRFDHRQHHLHGDRGVDHAAAALEGVEPGGRGQRIGGGDHASLRLGLRLSLGLGGGGRAQGDGGQEPYGAAG